MTSRASRWWTAVVALVASFALSGCTFHPGSAAVVDGTTISQSEVDDLVLAACDYFGANRQQNGGGKPDTPVAFVRHLIMQNLISVEIADQAARELHLTVGPADVAKQRSSIAPTLPPGLSSSASARLDSFFTRLTTAQLEQAVIGAHLKDPSVTDATHVTPDDVQAAEGYMSKYTRKQDVQVNPAYGSWNGQTLAKTDGSLSVPKSAAAATWLRLRQSTSNDVTGLPPSQVCG